jgi:Holliday junction resolvase RusA-like endonuclease
MIAFTIHGEATAKGRPKFSTRGGFARAYTPKKTQDAEYNFQAQAVQYKPSSPLTGPLVLTLKFYRAKGIPSTKKGLESALRGDIRPIKKPDIDNLSKLVMDAMNGIFWKDDAQVVEKHSYKHYSENPRIEVTVEVLQCHP